MAKKNKVGTLYFEPAKGLTVPGKKEGDWLKLGNIIITDGLAQQIFAEDEEEKETDTKGTVTIRGDNLDVS